MSFRPVYLPSRAYFRVCVSVEVFLSTEASLQYTRDPLIGTQVHPVVVSLSARYILPQGRRAGRLWVYFYGSFLDVVSIRELFGMAGRPRSRPLGVDSGPREAGPEGVRGAPKL